jgi:valyl-tRNA synthetase
MPGRDILLNISDVEGYRKFCNKLWNATKFCMFKLGMVDIEGVRQESDFVPSKTDAVSEKTIRLSLADQVFAYRRLARRPLPSDGSCTS